MEHNYKDLNVISDGHIDVGVVRNFELEHLVHLLRKRSKVLVAFGSCAVTGGISGLANLSDRIGVFGTVYQYNASIENPDLTVPMPSSEVEEGELTIPEFFDIVKTLDQTVDVDYYLPGCPPPTKLILQAVGAIIKGDLPPRDRSSPPPNGRWPSGPTIPASDAQLIRCLAPCPRSPIFR